MDLIPAKRAPRSRTLPSVIFLSLGLMLRCVSSTTSAQETPTTPATESASKAEIGSVRGSVTDADGAVITGAQVLLTTGSTSAQTVSGSDGSFSFAHIGPGPFRLTVTTTGFAAKAVSATLPPNESYDVPPIALAAAADIDVQVILSQHDLAQAQVKAEEKQRLAGFLPNFFVTYDWHAAPLSPRQKYELAWRTTLDPASLIVDGAIAGVQQAQNDYSAYGQGAAGYGKRFGAAFADSAVGDFLGGAILPSLLHQDPRYFCKGTGTIQRRALYALSAAVICHGDNGHWQPNYSGVFGDLAAGGISNLYYPSANRNGARLTFENGLLGVVGDAVGNVIQEFVFRKITPHLPPSNSVRP